MQTNPEPAEPRDEIRRIRPYHAAINEALGVTLDEAEAGLIETLIRLEVGLDEGGAGCLDGLSRDRLFSLARTQVELIRAAVAGDGDAALWIRCGVAEFVRGEGRRFAERFADLPATSPRAALRGLAGRLADRVAIS